MEFYIEIDKGGPNWKYILRVRKYPKSAPLMLATFNPYVVARHPKLLQTIIETLNGSVQKIDLSED